MDDPNENLGHKNRRENSKDTMIDKNGDCRHIFYNKKYRKSESVDCSTLKDITNTLNYEISNKELKIKHRYVCLDDSSYNNSINRSEIGVNSILPQKNSQQNTENVKNNNFACSKENIHPKPVFNKKLETIKISGNKLQDLKHLCFYAPDGSPAQKEIVSILDLSSIIYDNY